MLYVREPVDHGHTRMLGQHLNGTVREGPSHDPLDPSLQVSGNIRHAFPRAQLNVLRPQINGVAAQLPHPGLKRHAGPQRWLLKDHGQHSAGQQRRPVARLRAALQVRRHVEDVAELLWREVVYRNEISSAKCHSPWGQSSSRAKRSNLALATRLLRRSAPGNDNRVFTSVWRSIPL